MRNRHDRLPLGEALISLATRRRPVGRHFGKAFVRFSCIAGRNESLPPEPERFVLFIGYPRSGHSLVGSLLNAHPDAQIAHELDVLGLLWTGVNARHIRYLIHRRDRSFTARGRGWTGYDYGVGSGWEGRLRNAVIIGDKKGGRTSERLADEPSLLPRFEQIVARPVVLLHHVRDPYENVASMIARSRGANESSVVARYERMCVTNQELIERRDGLVITTYHDDLRADPERELRSLVEAVGLAVDGEWLERAAATVDTSTPPRPVLSETVTAEVRRLTAAIPFLERYR